MRLGKGMTGVATVVGLLMVAAGCSTIGPLQAGDLPRDAQIAGGGFRVSWKAPTDGTAILYERKSGKIVETESLSEGDSYEFDVDLSDEEVVQTFEKTFGIPVKNAKLVLYFKPASSESQAP